LAPPFATPLFKANSGLAVGAAAPGAGFGRQCG